MPDKNLRSSGGQKTVAKRKQYSISEHDGDDNSNDCDENVFNIGDNSNCNNNSTTLDRTVIGTSKRRNESERMNEDDVDGVDDEDGDATRLQ